jgi:hypothetical protein
VQVCIIYHYRFARVAFQHICWKSAGVPIDLVEHASSTEIPLSISVIIAVRILSLRPRIHASLAQGFHICYYSLRTYGALAQSVEQWPEEPRVVGSIPTGATMRV